MRCTLATLSLLVTLGCASQKDDAGATDSAGSTTHASDTADSGDPDDSGGSSTTSVVDEDSLNGTVPDDPVNLPEFAATNSDGAARSREDVLGDPTVIWFFPAAGTYG